MPITSQYQQNLIQSGLSPAQALVYEILLKNGPLPARKIARETPYKRTLIYKTLEELQGLGLVLRYDEPGKISVFEPQHPIKLKEVVEKQEQKAEIAQSALEGVLGNLVSDFNLFSGKPGVRFYEGKEGVMKAYEEILKVRQPIDSIEDKGEMMQFIPDFIRGFIKKRVKLGIRNRVVAPADNTINVDSEKELRQTRVIPTSEFPFRMDIKIAGNLVSLITLQKQNAVAVLIDNPEIAENFRLLFNLLWNSLSRKPALPLPQA